MKNLPARAYLFFNENLSNEVLSEIKGEYKKINSGSYVLISGSKLTVEEILLKDGSTLVFVGDFYDPDVPEKLNGEVVCDIAAKIENGGAIHEAAYSLFGKWVVIHIQNSMALIVGDPHHTKGIYYHQHKCVVSSMASLVAEVTNEKSIVSNGISETQFVSTYFPKTNWWCGNATYFNHVLALTPNKSYRISSGEICIEHSVFSKKQQHFSSEAEYENFCVQRSHQLLAGFFKSLSNREAYGLTLTGGKDSRLMFAASMSGKPTNAHYFTTKNIGTLDSHPDLQIPLQLGKHVKSEIHVYERREEDGIFSEINCYFPEVSSYYAKLIYSQYLNGIETVVLGLIPEAISVYYYNRVLRVNGKSLADIARHANNSFAEAKYEEWIAGIDENSLPTGYHLVDLFYWEQRGGRWGNQTTHIADLFEKQLWAFNCREFYDIWMRTNAKVRKYPQRSNLKKIIATFGSEFLEVPFAHRLGKFNQLRGEFEKYALTSLFARQIEYKKRRYFRK